MLLIQIPDVAKFPKKAELHFETDQSVPQTNAVSRHTSFWCKNQL